MIFVIVFLVLQQIDGNILGPKILGNHTDYNQGFVLSCAVSRKTAVALAPSAGRICRLKDFRDGIINSDILGCAFEPEQRFESPDGSAIVFDRDYLGNTRGVGVLPGPFASAEDAEKALW